MSLVVTPTTTRNTPASNTSGVPSGNSPSSGTLCNVTLYWLRNGSPNASGRLAETSDTISPAKAIRTGSTRSTRCAASTPTAKLSRITDSAEPSPPMKPPPGRLCPRRNR